MHEHEEHIDTFMALPIGGRMEKEIKIGHGTNHINDVLSDLREFGTLRWETYRLPEKHATIKLVITKTSCTHHVVPKQDINEMIRDKFQPQDSD